MQFSEWEGEYEAILRELRFSREEDERCAHLLRELLAGRSVSPRVLSRLVRGREVIVVGAGPGPIPRHLLQARDRLVIAADGATSTCLDEGVLPGLIVTDLDGDMPDEVRANREGSLVLVHAHGDNPEAVRKWVPRLEGRVCGSTAAAPAEGLVNFGGFTDGDRSVFLAEALGAQGITLVGFDFGHVRPGEGPTKLRKLRVAERLIGEVAARGKVRIDRYTAAGITRWPARGAGTTRPAGPRSRRAA